jgi:hypothetical protein
MPTLGEEGWSVEFTDTVTYSVIYGFRVPMLPLLKNDDIQRLEKVR